MNDAARIAELEARLAMVEAEAGEVISRLRTTLTLAALTIETIVKGLTPIAGEFPEYRASSSIDRERLLAVAVCLRTIVETPHPKAGQA